MDPISGVNFGRCYLDPVEHRRPEDIEPGVDLVGYELLGLLNELVDLAGGLIVHDHTVLGRLIDLCNLREKKIFFSTSVL